MTNNRRIMRRLEVQATTGLSRSTIYAKMEAGKFPKPIKLGARSVGWLEHEVQGWLEASVLASRKGGLSHVQS